MEDEVEEVMMVNVQVGTQDLDPFDLGPIMTAVNRKSKKRKRRIAEVEEDVDVWGGDECSVHNKSSYFF